MQCSAKREEQHKKIKKGLPHIKESPKQNYIKRLDQPMENNGPHRHRLAKDEDLSQDDWERLRVAGWQHSLVP